MVSTAEPETTAEMLSRAEPESTPEAIAELMTTEETFGLFAAFVAILFIFCFVLLFLWFKQKKRLDNIESHGKTGNFANGEVEKKGYIA